jgi:addiction module HigA family antidote
MQVTWNSFAEDDMSKGSSVRTRPPRSEEAMSSLEAVEIQGVNIHNLDEFLGDGHVTPLHPGILYRTWVIAKRDLTVSSVAEQADISREMLHRILRGEGSITAKTAIGLAEVAGNDPEFWLRAQAIYDLWTERERRKQVAQASPPSP